MMKLRRSQDRGLADYGWLKSRHTFSFAEYMDREHMGFGALRVINDDRVAPGAGFPTHPHRNMEILSYVVEGALEHRDSMGNGSVIHPGEVQRMTAGTGVTHSEFNHHQDAGLRFLQIWIVPETFGLKPSYEQKSFTDQLSHGLKLVASPDGQEGSLRVHQDALVYASVLEPNAMLTRELSPGRQYWLQVVGGDVVVNDQHLLEGDAVAMLDEQRLQLGSGKGGHVLLFDLKRSDA